jgi:hypothetical protein
MREYEYEVTFFGSHWKASVYVYHELDIQEGEEERDKVQGWAEGVADQLGLGLGDFHEVVITKVATL